MELRSTDITVEQCSFSWEEEIKRLQEYYLLFLNKVYKALCVTTQETGCISAMRGNM